MPTDTQPRITVCVATRNRPASLLRCLSALQLIDDLVGEVIVADDCSDPPVRGLLDGLPPALANRLRVIDLPADRGYIAGRNMMVRLASHEFVLSMDDDAYVIDGDGVRRAVAVLMEHADVGAVACAQAEADGRPWPAAMQPAQAEQSCVVAAFIGFAHLIRRSVFLDLGGYREIFYFYGEEKDYCLRLLNAGHRVVYLPDALVAHVPDPAGRSASRYLRYVVRNDCLSALYNEPLLLALATVPLRLARYLSMRRHANVDDPGGLWWILGAIAMTLPHVLRNRTPVRWATLKRWHTIRRQPPPFSAPTPLIGSPTA